MFTTPLYLKPAYGRTYATAADMVKDWNDGKDFLIYGGGPYCSIRDTEQLEASSITFIDFRSNIHYTI